MFGASAMPGTTCAKQGPRWHILAGCLQNVLRELRVRLFWKLGPWPHLQALLLWSWGVFESGQCSGLLQKPSHSYRHLPVNWGTAVTTGIGILCGNAWVLPDMPSPTCGLEVCATTLLASSTALSLALFCGHSRGSHNLLAKGLSLL